MEPITSATVTALATKGSEAGIDLAKEGAKGLIQTLLGPSTNAWGEYLALGPKERLFNNLVDVVVRANQKVKAAGIDPKQVPLKIIHPMLEAASVEEEPDMQEVWANMIANAADPRQLAPVSASFPAILKELTPREVKFLDAFYRTIEARSEKRAVKSVKRVGVLYLEFEEAELQFVYIDAGLCVEPYTSPRPDICEMPGSRTFAWPTDGPFFGQEFTAERRNFEYMLGLLRRHSLVAQLDRPFLVDHNSDMKDSVSTDASVELYTKFFMTDIGRYFVEACRPLRESE